MEQQQVVRQTQLEKKMLAYIVEGLFQTIAWKVHTEGLVRKLATLRFIARSFQRHIARLLALEEQNGYMGEVLQTHPHFSQAVEGLRQEHKNLRDGVERVVQGLSQVGPHEEATLTQWCNQLMILLKQFNQLQQKEAHILQEAMERDEGGEG